MRHTKIQYYEKHEGLVLKSKLFCNIMISLRLTLPCSLMPSYWIKNKLSASDVASILDANTSRDVWLLGFAVGAVTLAPSSFRTSYSSPADISITSKASVIRKILFKLGHLLVLHKNSALNDCGVSLQHIPALPKHYVTEQEFYNVSQDILPCIDMLHVIKVNKLFLFQGTKWVAIAFEGDAIFALRAVEETIYKKSNRPAGLLSRSPTIEVNSIRFQLLPDDGILFVAAG